MALWFSPFAGIEARTITPSPYWANEIVFPDDPFAVVGTSSTDPGWVKFAILLPPYDPGVVYFQDCKAYPFHYDFAVNHLDPFLGMTFDDLRNARDYRLETSGVTQLVSPAQSPILTLRDFANPVVHVDYAQPVPSWDWNGPTTTKSDSVMLWPKPPAQPGDKLQTRRYQDAEEGISITTSFYWPPYPKGVVAGYTAPLVRWQQSQISGLTTAPIVLRGDYSQTYRPEHHNFGEHFLFEPRLEQGISPSILNELRLKDIRLIHFAAGMGPTNTITIYGFDKEMFATDLDGDGDVDAVDLALLGRYWQKTACGPCGGGDFNGDNKVGLDDLTGFAFDWLNEYYWGN